MKKIALFLFFLSITFYAISQQNLQLVNSEVSISGTSTMHDWKIIVTDIDFIGKADMSGKDIKSLRDIHVKIPVKNLKSEKQSSAMDKNTYRALKSDEFEVIQFVTVSPVSISGISEGIEIDLNGKLTIAGVTQDMLLKASGSKMKDNKIRFSGSLDLLMSEFKVEAPTFLMGAFKTGDKVTVEYNIELKIEGEHNNVDG